MPNLYVANTDFMYARLWLQYACWQSDLITLYTQTHRRTLIINYSAVQKYATMNAIWLVFGIARKDKPIKVSPKPRERHDCLAIQTTEFN